MIISKFWKNGMVAGLTWGWTVAANHVSHAA